MPLLFVNFNITKRIVSIVSHSPPSFVFRLTLLLANTNGSSSSTGSLRMLSSYSETPVVSETTMCSYLLQSFQIFAKFAFHTVGQNLIIFAINNISLSVKEPCRDLVLSWILRKLEKLAPCPCKR